ncbi:MAG TPA: FtsX-like permease family protein [Prosthecobacter sp.]
MLSNAALFLARRYLRAGRSFVSVITIVSILGVMLGVLTMIVVNSVMKGFEGEFRRILIGSQPHMLLHPLEEKPTSPEAAAELLAKVRQQPEVAAASTYVSGTIYAEHETQQSAMRLLGLPSDGTPFYLAKTDKKLLDGSLDLRPGGIVTPDYIAGQLDAHPGDKIGVYPATNVTEVVHRYREASDEQDQAKREAAYEKIKLPAQEIEMLGYVRAEMDIPLAYTPLETAQKILNLGTSVNGVVVELKDPNAAKATAARFAEAGMVPEGWKATLWLDANESRLAAMSNERFMMRIVLVIIGFVAAFSVMNTTITVTTQKRREIGVLTALGSRQGQIISIFVSQAAFVGVLGTLAGLGLSALVLTFRNELRMLIALASGEGGSADAGMFLGTIPAQIEPWFIVWTSLGSVALCLLAALPPAWLAARVDPAVALRD